MNFLKHLDKLNMYKKKLLSNVRLRKNYFKSNLILTIYNILTMHKKLFNKFFFFENVDQQFHSQNFFLIINS